MSKIQALLTIEDVQELLPGISQRTLKEELRKYKCAHEIRGKLLVSVDDLNEYLEKKHLCQIQSKKEVKSGTLTRLSPDAALDAALKLANEKKRNVSRRKSKRESTVKKSMARNGSTPSLKLVSST